MNYTIGDAQTPVNDLTIIASSTSPAIIFTADNVGTGAARNATVEAVDPVAGGTGMLTLTVTHGAGRTASTTFSVTFDPVITTDAGPDQNVTANQAVAVSSTVTGTTSTTWTSSGTGSFDNAAATSTNYNPSQADYQAGTVTLTLTASPTGGATCPGASDALVVTFNRPDRTVTGNETISGVYNNVLVIAGAVANNGALDVSGSLVVQSGGSLRSSPCAPVTGAGTFTLEDGATLEICDSQGISTTGMLGQIQVTGARSYGAGANYIYASNAVAQNSGSGLPLDLTGTISVDNGAGGVDLTSNLRLHGVLTLINGDLRVTETASLTIASDAIGTGAVENRAGEVTGTATVQRYISSSLSTAPGYHHLSSPVTAATVGDLATTGFTPVVNNTYNNAGNTNIVQPYPNVFAYDERRAPTSPDFTRGYFSPATLGEVLEPGRGYSVYINGGLTPDFVGTLTNGTINRNGLTRTGNFTGGGQKSGWHITGNPYPSPIDWDLVNVPAGMSNAVFVWRSTGGLNGSYVSYVNGSGTPGTDLIGLGQGIFVRVTSVTPVDFSFTNECRVTNTNVAVFRTAPATRPQLTLSLRGTTAPAAEATEAYVYFQHGATAGYDASFDAARPARNVGVPTLATVVADEELAVNALAPEALAAGTRLPLMVDVPAAGTYELAAKELTNLTGTDVYLLDAVTGTAQPLTADARYRFTTSAAGEQANRFALRFGAGAAANSIAANTLTVSPNPATGRAQVRLTYPATSLTLVDALGRTVRTLALGAGQTDATLDLHNLPAGVYSVRAGASTTRLVVE